MTEQHSEAVQTRTEGHIFEVTLDRPKANAIDLVTSRRMGEVFKSFRDDPELRVCIVRTAGEKFFSAGWASGFEVVNMVLRIAIGAVGGRSIEHALTDQPSEWFPDLVHPSISGEFCEESSIE